MLANAVRRTLAPRAAPLRRLFSDASSEIRRPKAIRVKKGEARRRVDPKPKTDALVEQQEVAEAPAPYTQGPFSPQQTHQTFGGMMKESFLWGIGMALAFTFVGVIFSSMEEAPETGIYDGSVVVTKDQQGEEE